MREVKAGEYYRHFKGGLYQVTGIAKDAGTERPVVVYQALYGEEELWVRDYEEFVSEVDRAKYPDAEQQYRFEKIEEPKETNPLLLRFLDAETYEDKLELFQSWEAYASLRMPSRYPPSGSHPIFSTTPSVMLNTGYSPGRASSMKRSQPS